MAESIPLEYYLFDLTDVNGTRSRALAPDIHVDACCDHLQFG